MPRGLLATPQERICRVCSVPFLATGIRQYLCDEHRSHNKNGKMSTSYGREYYKKNKQRIDEEIRIRGRSLPGRWASLKSSAKSRGILLTLTFEEYATLITDAVCFYCGGVLCVVGGGLDRLDRNEGYTKSNVVPCCCFRGTKGCNYKKALLETAGFSLPRIIELMRELNQNKGATQK